MKNTRGVFIVFGIVLLMFVIAPYVSAQPLTGYFQGKGSLKGYEISGTGAIVGKASGGANIFVNIVDDAVNNQYKVTTCSEDSNGVWHLGVTTAISKLNVYGDPNTAMIWDFAEASELNFYQTLLAYPMFYVKINGSLTSANFKSFACVLRDDSNPPDFKLGSCSATFKNVDVAKVPAGCKP